MKRLACLVKDISQAVWQNVLGYLWWAGGREGGKSERKMQAGLNGQQRLSSYESGKQGTFPPPPTAIVYGAKAQCLFLPVCILMSNLNVETLLGKMPIIKNNVKRKRKSSACEPKSTSDSLQSI